MFSSYTVLGLKLCCSLGLKDGLKLFVHNICLFGEVVSGASSFFFYFFCLDFFGTGGENAFLEISMI